MNDTWVKCVDNRYLEDDLTINLEYKIVSVNGCMICVQNDLGIICGYPDERFVEV